MIEPKPHTKNIKGLRFRFSGVPACFIGQREVHLGTRKALALLAYLAIRKVSVARSELDVLLWPDHDGERARRSLRDELSRINKVLGKDLIISSGQNLTLNRDNLELDLWQFEVALVKEDFLKAVSLYQGSFLEGLYVKEASPFENWLEDQRDLFEQKYLFALEQLALQAELIEDYVQALDYYRQCLTIDPLREKCFYAAIKAALSASDRSGALKLVEDLKQACLELGITPDPQVDKWLTEVPAKSLDRSPWHNLPGTLTSLIGRESLLEQAKYFLSRADVRLLTLTGPGGVGKTRLSLQIAKDVLADFKDGVLWLELAPLRTPEELLAKLMTLLELPDTQTMPLEAIVSSLKNKHRLLLLDNFEHLTEAAIFVNDLIKACSGLKVLVTSRVSLKLQGEFRLFVPPLDLPDIQDPLNLISNPAIELFKQRALAVDPNFRIDQETLLDLSNICVQLDGLPLAIELAAARIKLFSPRALLERLEQRFSLLQSSDRGLADRQKSLKHSLDWSYEALNSTEQNFLNRLGIFIAGFGFEAVEVICLDLKTNPIEVLESLIDQSMVQRSLIGSEPRFSLLESIREVCLENLETENSLRLLQEKHAIYYLGLVEACELQLMSSEQAVVLIKLELEQSNIRAALSFFERHDPEKFLQLAAGLWHYWRLRGQFGEGRLWLEKALARPINSKSARAKALNCYGSLALQQGDLEKAKPYFQEALSLWQDTYNKTGIASVLNNLGILARRQGDLELAQSYYLNCLALRRELGNRYGEAAILRNLGSLAIHQEHWESAQLFLEQALILSQDLGEQSGIGSTLSNLGLVRLYQGDVQASILLYQESLAFNRLSDDKISIAISLGNLGSAFLKVHRFSDAEQCFRENLGLSKAIGDQEGIASSLEGLACIFALSDPEWAAKLYGKASDLRNKLGLMLSSKDQEQLQSFMVPAIGSLGDDFYALVQAAKYLDIDRLLKRTNQLHR